MSDTKNRRFRKLTHSDIEHIESVGRSSGLQFTDLEFRVCSDERSVELINDDFRLSIHRTPKGYSLTTTEFVVSEENGKVYEEHQGTEEDDDRLFKLTEWITPFLVGVDGPLRPIPPKTKRFDHDFFSWEPSNKVSLTVRSPELKKEVV